MTSAPTEKGAALSRKASRSETTAVSPAAPGLTDNHDAVADTSQEFKADRRFWLALTPILVMAAMVSLDGTAITVALPVRELIFYLPSALLSKVQPTAFLSVPSRYC